MHLSNVLSPLVWGVAVSTTMAVADADFLQVRRHNPSNYNEQPAAPEQYFSEASFHPRYDGRFAQQVLSYDEQNNVTKNLVQTYLNTVADLGVETWLTHSALLGWWWGKKVLPWDAAIDVQITEASIHYLASYYNMSTFYYETAQYPEGNSYLLEVNPNYVDRDDSKGLNSVDARWIDTESGIFIDISAVRYSLAHPDGDGMLSTKDGQEFMDTYLYPLHITSFEGFPVKIPYKYKDILESEYGPKALVDTKFADHWVFDDEKMEWVPEHIENTEAEAIDTASDIAVDDEL